MKDGWTFAKELSNALLKVRPLGGSELFVKRNDQYYADPEYCGRMIDEMRTSLDLEIRARIRAEREIVRLKANESNILSAVNCDFNSRRNLG